MKHRNELVRIVRYFAFSGFIAAVGAFTFTTGDAVNASSTPDVVVVMVRGVDPFLKNDDIDVYTGTTGSDLYFEDILEDLGCEQPPEPPPDQTSPTLPLYMDCNKFPNVAWSPFSYKGVDWGAQNKIASYTGADTGQLISTSATHLEAQIDLIRLFAGQDVEIILVAHSLGGAVATVWAQTFNEPDVPIITMDSPLNGIWVNDPSSVENFCAGYYVTINSGAQDSLGMLCSLLDLGSLTPLLQSDAVGELQNGVWDQDKDVLLMAAANVQDMFVPFWYSAANDTHADSHMVVDCDESPWPWDVDHNCPKSDASVLNGIYNVVNLISVNAQSSVSSTNEEIVAWFGGSKLSIPNGMDVAIEVDNPVRVINTINGECIPIAGSTGNYQINLKPWEAVHFKLYWDDPVGGLHKFRKFRLFPWEIPPQNPYVVSDPPFFGWEQIENCTDPPDSTPPSAPANLEAAANFQSIELTWSPAVDDESDIDLYRIFRGLVSGGGKTLLTEVSGAQLDFTDLDLDAEEEYFYKVAAVNSVGIQGPGSNEATDTTPPPPVATIDIALIIDSSGSMGWNDSDDKRLTAAIAYISPGSSAPGDQIAVVGFDSSATVYSQLRSVPEEFDALQTVIATIPAAGGTDNGAGIQAGCDELIASVSGNLASGAILLTDGEDTDTYLNQADCFESRGWPIYTFALGDDADEAFLQSIADQTGGEFAQLPTTDLICEFQKVRNKIAGNPGAECFSDPIVQSETLTFPQDVESGQEFASFTTSWAGSEVLTTLISPSGREIDRNDTAPDVTVNFGPTFEIFTIESPEAGEWQMSLFGSDIPAGGEQVVYGVTTTESVCAELLVTTEDDEFDSPQNGFCSLREAIHYANNNVGPDTITLPEGGYQLTMNGSAEDGGGTGDLDIFGDLTIDGAGAATTVIDGQSSDRVFDIFGPVTVSIAGVTVQNGRADSMGGGIRNDGGVLTVSDSVVQNNTAHSGASSSGEDGADGGAIWNPIGGTVNIIRSTVTGNSAGNGAYGCSGPPEVGCPPGAEASGGSGGRGGGIANLGILSLVDSSISNNASGDGGGSERTGGSGASGGGGGGIFNLGAATVSRSTISSNVTGDGGWGADSEGPGHTGGNGGDGAGIFNSATLSVQNTTVSGNAAGSGGRGGSTLIDSEHAGNGGNGGRGGGIFSLGTADITNVTLFGNSTGVGGPAAGGVIPGVDGLDGLGGGAFNGSGSLSPLNTIIAGNLLGNDCSGAITSLGHNLDSDGSCLLAVIGDQSGIDPLMGPLQANGGPTSTHAALDGSSVIDGGDSSITGVPWNLITDQRGWLRWFDNSVDIGATESPYSNDCSLLNVNTFIDEFDAVPNGSCSLREAIAYANNVFGPDTFTLPSGTYSMSIWWPDPGGIERGDLNITDDLTIQGSGAGVTVIDGNSVDRVFYVSSGTSFVISDLTIQGGSPPLWTGDGLDGHGGGILNDGGVLTITDSVVQFNSALDEPFSGSIPGRNGGGIWNSVDSTLTVVSSTITGNTAGSGTFPLGDGGHGGGIVNHGIAHIIDSTISNNNSGDPGDDLNALIGALGGQGGDGGGIYNTGSLIVEGSTVSGNVTANGGTGGSSLQQGGTGGFGGNGSGIFNGSGADLTISNSTVSSNLGGNGGNGGFPRSGDAITGLGGDGGSGSGIYNGGTAELVNVTVVLNTSGSAGGGSAAGSAGQAGGIHTTGFTSTLNAIIANNFVGTDCFGTVSSQGYNLDSDGSCLLSAPGDVSGVDPLLGPLQNNGGPTETHDLLTGSPAIDAGDSSVTGVPWSFLFDQRGKDRLVGTTVDIGAVEHFDPSLVGHWKLDDIAGLTAADSSGNGNHGTLVDGPVWSAGTLAGALTFDGSNDYVDLPSAVMNGTGDSTVAFWFKTTKTGQQAVISAANAVNSNEYLIFLASSTTIRLYTSGNANQWTVPSFADDTWRHVAVVRDDINNLATLYIDGVSQGTLAINMSALSVEAGGLVLGQEQDSVGAGFDATQSFAGSLDDVRIYTKTLTEIEIQDLLNPGSTNAAPELTSHSVSPSTSEPTSVFTFSAVVIDEDGDQVDVTLEVFDPSGIWETQSTESVIGNGLLQWPSLQPFEPSDANSLAQYRFQYTSPGHSGTWGPFTGPTLEDLPTGWNHFGSWVHPNEVEVGTPVHVEVTITDGLGYDKDSVVLIYDHGADGNPVTVPMVLKELLNQGSSSASAASAESSASSSGSETILSIPANGTRTESYAAASPGSVRETDMCLRVDQFNSPFNLVCVAPTSTFTSSDEKFYTYMMLDNVDGIWEYKIHITPPGEARITYDTCGGSTCIIGNNGPGTYGFWRWWTVAGTNWALKTGQWQVEIEVGGQIFAAHDFTLGIGSATWQADIPGAPASDAGKILTLKSRANEMDGAPITSITRSIDLLDPLPNVAPLVDAGPADTIPINLIAGLEPWVDHLLDGTVSDDGQVLATPDLTWSLVSGPVSAVIDSPNAVDTSVRFFEYGTYVFRLTADDGEFSPTADVTITVVEAGHLELWFPGSFQPVGPEGGPFVPSSENYTLSNSGGFPLDWSGSFFVDWLDVSTTGGSLDPGDSIPVTISLNSNANLLPADPVWYSDVVVFHNDTFSDPGHDLAWRSVYVDLQVDPAPIINLPPNVDAGPADTVPINLIAGLDPWVDYVLDGTVSDDGQILGTPDLTWSLVSGPVSAIIASPNTVDTSVRFFEYGAYVFRLTADDGEFSPFADVPINVVEAGHLVLGGPSQFFSSSGIEGGPFVPSGEIYTLSNSGDFPLNWSGSFSVGWLDVSAIGGSLAPGESISVTVSINISANALTAAGSPYSDVVVFHNDTNSDSGNDNPNRTVFVDLIVDPAPPTPSLAGHWKLDDIAGLTAADSSGNGNHGTLVDGPVWSAGILAGALTLDGNNDFVDLPSTVMNGTGDSTVAFWFKTTKTGQQAVVSAANAVNSNEYLIFIASSTWIRLYTSGNAIQWTVPSISDDSWHHMAIVRDDSNNLATLYLEGVSQGTKAINMSALSVEAGGLVLGQEQDSVGGGYDATQSFAGSLDDVRIYTKTLTDVEVFDLLNPGPPANVAPNVDAGSPDTVPLWLEEWFQGETAGNYVDHLLDGTVSDDGQVLATPDLTWSLVSGPVSAFIWSPNTVDTDVTFSEHGTYVFRLTADDGEFSPTSDVTITVVEAGHLSLADPDGGQPLFSPYGYEGGPFDPASRTFTLSNSGGFPLDWSGNFGVGWLDVSVTGGSLDPGESIPVTVSVNSNADLLPPDTHNFEMEFWNLTNGDPGSYLFRTVVVNLIVDPAPIFNLPPNVDAGSPDTVPINLVAGLDPWVDYVLDGTVSDDGQLLATPNLTWSLVSGPVSAVIDSPNTEDTSVRFFEYGAYVFRITADDGEFSPFADVPINVVEAGHLVLGGPSPFQPVGPEGGPFAPSSEIYTLSNSGGFPLNWSEVHGVSWLDVSLSSGSLDPGESIPVIISVNANANALPADDDWYIIYHDVVVFHNDTNSDSGHDLASRAVYVDLLVDPAPPTPSLEGHWKLDDIAGLTAADSSGNANHGTLVDGPVWSAGTLAGALTFDGSNDYVDLPSAVMNGTGDSTVAFWFKTTKTGQQAVVSAANAVNSNEYLIFLASSTTIRLYTSGNANQWTVPSFADDTWRHVAVVRDDINNLATLYIDGVSQGTLAINMSALSVEAGGLVLGQEQDSVGAGFDATQSFAGSLDDIRIYTKTLTEIEIQDLLNPGPPANVAPLVGAGPDTTVPLWLAEWFPGETAGNYVDHLLDGTVTDDGQVLATPDLTWSLVSGPVSAVIDSSNTEDTSVRFFEHGTYVFRLTADDGEFSPFADVTITVVESGHLSLTDPDGGQPLFEPSGIVGGPFTPSSRTFTLSNSGGFPLDWSVVGPAWLDISTTSGTLGASVPVTISVNSNADLLPPDTYYYELTFWNNTGGDPGSYLFRTVVVTLWIDPLPNSVPDVDAGPADTIPINLEDPFPGPWVDYLLDGTVTDDGVILATPDLTWSLVSGPVSAFIASPNTEDTGVTFFEYGTYVFRLTADDGEFSSFADVTITVVEAGHLSLSDPDGGQPLFLPSGYEGGPFVPSSEIYTLSNSGGFPLDWSGSSSVGWLDVSVTGGSLNPGESIPVTISLNGGANALTAAGSPYSEIVGFHNETNSDPGNDDPLRSVQVDLWIDPAPIINLLPNVDAGPDTTVPLWLEEYFPGETAGNFVDHLLDGTVSDDGQVLATPDLTWNLVSGPVSAFIATPNAEDTSVTFTEHGTYVFRLTADDGEFSPTADVTITVVESGHLSLTDPDGGQPLFEPWGYEGGPFTPSSRTFTLSNSGGFPLDWSAPFAVGWLDVSVTGGSLNPGESIPVTVSVNSNTDLLPDDTHHFEMEFWNLSGWDPGPYLFRTVDVWLFIDPAPPTPSLAGHWKLDDIVGLTAADSSGNANHGTLVDGPVWSAGTLAGALTFDGSNDYVDLPSTVMNGVGDSTVAFWFKTTKTGQQAVVSAANGVNSNEYLIFLASNTVVRLYTSGNAVQWTVLSFADDTWHHVAVVRDDINNLATLYIDGVSQGTLAINMSALSVEAGGLVLGQEQDSVGAGFDATQSFAGSLDDVRIYTKTLTEIEILALLP